MKAFTVSHLTNCTTLFWAALTPVMIGLSHCVEGKINCHFNTYNYVIY